MKVKHMYFTNPERFYTTQITQLNIAHFNLTIEEIQDLDKCIDFQCELLEKNPLPLPYKGILEDLCPYFAKIWDSALNLSHWITKNQNIFEMKRSLEIGAGLAIPSIILAKLGHHVTATDYHPHTNFFSDKNKKLNEVSFPYLQHNWNELHTLVPQFDVIIASDILYEGRYISDLTKLLREYLSPAGIFLICDPVRGYLQKFISELEDTFHIELETINFSGQDHFLVKIKWPLISKK